MLDVATITRRLEEARSRAPLYHFLPLWMLTNVLKHDVLGGPSFSKPIAGMQPRPINVISLTRDPRLWLHGEVRLELDQDKLRTKYKIRPHADMFVDPGPKSHDDHMVNQPWYERRWESEERIKIIKPLSRYLLGIHINKRGIDDLIRSARGIRKSLEHNAINLELIKEGKMLPGPNHPWYQGEGVVIDVPNTPKARKLWNYKSMKRRHDDYKDTAVAEYNAIYNHPLLSAKARRKLSKHFPLRA